MSLIREKLVIQEKSWNSNLIIFLFYNSLTDDDTIEMNFPHDYELLIVLRFDFDSSFEFVMVRILTSDCNP